MNVQATEPLDLSSDESLELGVRLTQAARRLIRDLVRVRDERGYSRSQVADAIGIHRSGVTRFERQEKSPRLETVLRYAHAVGADIAFAVVPVDGWECEDSTVVTHIHTWRSEARSDIPLRDEDGWHEQIELRL